MNLTLLGINHRTAPVEVREKMNIPAEQLAEAVADLVHREGISRGNDSFHLQPGGSDNLR